MAPGEDILTLTPGGGYDEWTGTSFATPLVSSVAAMTLVANPHLSPWQLMWILRRSSEDLGKRRRDWEYGFGLPDAGAAVSLALKLRGALRWRHRRLGIDPYVDNDLSSFAIPASATLALASHSAPLLIPEVSTALILVAGCMIVLCGRKNLDRRGRVHGRSR